MAEKAPRVSSKRLNCEGCFSLGHGHDNGANIAEKTPRPQWLRGHIGNIHGHALVNLVISPWCNGGIRTVIPPGGSKNISPKLHSVAPLQLHHCAIFTTTTIWYGDYWVRLGRRGQVAQPMDRISYHSSSFHAIERIAHLVLPVSRTRDVDPVN